MNVLNNIYKIQKMKNANDLLIITIFLKKNEISASKLKYSVWHEMLTKIDEKISKHMIVRF